jgi:hypothetical protein
MPQHPLPGTGAIGRLCLLTSNSSEYRFEPFLPPQNPILGFQNKGVCGLKMKSPFKNLRDGLTIRPNGRGRHYVGPGIGRDRVIRKERPTLIIKAKLPNQLRFGIPSKDSREMVFFAL